jgi:small GTP-binding protein
MLVVVGEFNAGKSAFINALLGAKLLKEGVTPTTTQINVLRYGDAEDWVTINEQQQILKFPVDWLAEISIVDTPGTNAVIRQHEEITSLFVPRSDLVLFITSADRPFTESERAFLEKIRDWGKKVLVIINKIDIIESQEEINQIKKFVTDSAYALLGITPEVFLVSARQGLKAKSGDPQLWETSRLGVVEDFIHDQLDEDSRIRLKFLNPLGVGEHLAKKYLNVITERQELIKEDIKLMSDVEAQLALYKEDMMRDFNFRLADIENILYSMEQRGQSFFDEAFRLARVMDLLSKDRIRNEFERHVIGDVPIQIEKKVTEIIDWLVESDLRQWQAITEHLAERRRKYKERIVGESSIGTFAYDRDRLIEAVGREAHRVVESYDKAEEARQIAESAQLAVAASAALEVGAIGLGALVTILATTAAADVTGIALAGVVAALGLFIIPARRKSAKAELKEKIANLRIQLTDTLQTEFQKELERSLHRINEAIAPYTRFVRAERKKIDEWKTALEDLHLEIAGMRARL